MALFKKNGTPKTKSSRRDRRNRDRRDDYYGGFDAYDDYIYGTDDDPYADKNRADDRERSRSRDREQKRREHRARLRELEEDAIDALTDLEDLGGVENLRRVLLRFSKYNNTENIAEPDDPDTTPDADDVKDEDDIPDPIPLKVYINPFSGREMTKAEFDNDASERRFIGDGIDGDTSPIPVKWNFDGTWGPRVQQNVRTAVMADSYDPKRFKQEIAAAKRAFRDR